MTKRIALVTGASRGIGKSAALKLAAQDIGIIVTYHSQAKEADNVVENIVSNGGKAVALRLNVSEINEFADFTVQLRHTLQEAFQRETFDYLINNAGTGLYTPFAEITEDQFETLLAVHFKGPFFLTQMLLPLIADNGHILNVSSGLTRFSYAGASAYAAMKGALEVLTRYLALELSERRIRVNTIAPGAVATDFNGGRTRDMPALNAAIAERTALGRVAVADDIGTAIAGILNEDMRWMNGQRIEFSGGIHL